MGLWPEKTKNRNWCHELYAKGMNEVRMIVVLMLSAPPRPERGDNINPKTITIPGKPNTNLHTTTRTNERLKNMCALKCKSNSHPKFKLPSHADIRLKTSFPNTA